MEATNIVDVVGEFVNLRKAGVNYKGLCPFHDDTTPSFMVSPARQICKCFACGEGGNAVNFLMKHEQITYPEALRWLAKKYNIDVRIGIYSTIDFFNTTQGLLDANDFVKRIPQNIHQTQENYDYVALYEQWRRGNLKLRCQSIKSSLVIHSNGNVPICQNLDVVLGNIHKQSLDEVFNGKPSCAQQCKYDKECNGCWINFHRKYDVILLRNFERLLPKWLIEKFYGKYQWTDDKRQTYAGYLKSVKK